jgi:hypothetical protein
LHPVISAAHFFRKPRVIVNAMLYVLVVGRIWRLLSGSALRRDYGIVSDILVDK